MSEIIHQPVLLAEVVAALRPHPAGRYVDGTVGGGGHAAAVLAASSPTGWLYGCDRDGTAIEAATRRLAPFEGRFALRHGNFADLAEWIEPESCDGVLLDLGASSLQFDDPDRGFSFQHDGPLDMRMDRRQSLTAAALVNELGADELARIFRDFGGEPQARRFAGAIVRERRRRRLATTRELAGLIERLSPRHGGKRHPATRAFMALRMAVNDELNSLQRALAAACTLLKRGGRLAVITFHSVEDRRVKEFGRVQAREYAFPGDVDVPELRTPRVPVLQWVHRRAIRPRAAELAANPRARSAQLRLLAKA